MKNTCFYRAIMGALLVILLDTSVVWGAENGPSFHSVDLTACYNQRPDTFPEGGCWTKVPMGRQVYDGVPFELGGVMELTGLGAARAGSIFPGRHTDISVGCKASWIHLIHGAGYAAEDGTVIAYLRLRYEGGLRHEIPLSYGVHTRNWWVEPTEEKSDVTDPNSKIAWTGSIMEGSRQQNVQLRLFKTSFLNPEPTRKIETMEVASAFSSATPFILGITFGDSGSSVKPLAAPSKLPGIVAPAKSVFVTVRDQGTDRPIVGARIQLSIICDNRAFPYAEQLADAAGSARVDCPERKSQLLIAATAPGLALQRLVADLARTNEKVTLKLEGGKTIGGFVRNSAKQPIAGARITISQNATNENGTLVACEIGPMVSGPDGRWECSNISRGATDLSFTISHANYKSANIDQITEGEADEFSVLREDLYASKAVFLLR